MSVSLLRLKGMPVLWVTPTEQPNIIAYIFETPSFGLSSNNTDVQVTPKKLLKFVSHGMQQFTKMRLVMQSASETTVSVGTGLSQIGFVSQLNAVVM